MDLAFSKLTEHGMLVFAISKEKLPVKEMTKEEVTELELPTPSNGEREACWKFFSQNYSLSPEVDLLEMATKFLFTPGKIKAALHQARSFATMDKEISIPRDTLFRGCNNQMSSELTQKATKVKANFGFEDIVMNHDQRETLEHAINQMNFRKQVYDNWNYTKKYPYGRGLSILLFGAPVRSFAAVLSRQPGLLELAWVQSGRPQDTAPMLLAAYAAARRSYPPETLLTVQAVNAASAKLLCAMLPEAAPISYTYYYDI